MLKNINMYNFQETLYILYDYIILDIIYFRRLTLAYYYVINK